MKKQPNLLNGQEPPEFRQKFKIAGYFLLIALSILLARLGYLQIVKGAEYRQKSENNSVRFRNLKPLRGLIMDRNGVVLVDNMPSFDVIYIPNKKKGNELSIEKLKNLYR
ncbi:MAG: hypothetical protein PHV90_10475, partial [Smithella sp.]|nr:hypothetical protein [Smithella sp.]